MKEDGVEKEKKEGKEVVGVGKHQRSNSTAPYLAHGIFFLATAQPQVTITPATK